MSFISGLKNNFKKYLKTGIIIVIVGAVVGILIALFTTKNTEWTPPRSVNREYRGEIIQKLRQGKSAPKIRQRSQEVKPETKKQKTKEVTPPPAKKKDFEPSIGDSYSDF